MISGDRLARGPTRELQEAVQTVKSIKAATAFTDSATAAGDGDHTTADERWDDAEASLEDADRCGE